jgi:hypothetical protein
MRVLQERSTLIHAEVGDTLELYSTDENGFETILLKEVLTEAQVINYIAAVTFEKQELDQLGLDKAIAGVFGHRGKK